MKKPSQFWQEKIVKPVLASEWWEESCLQARVLRNPSSAGAHILTFVASAGLTTGAGMAVSRGFEQLANGGPASSFFLFASWAATGAMAVAVIGLHHETDLMRESLAPNPAAKPSL